MPKTIHNYSIHNTKSMANDYKGKRNKEREDQRGSKGNHNR